MVDGERRRLQLPFVAGNAAQERHVEPQQAADFAGKCVVDPVTDSDPCDRRRWQHRHDDELIELTADDDHRRYLAVGTGLRISVPAMGPAPIALDFAWAVSKAPTDDPQVFSFSLGFSR